MEAIQSLASPANPGTPFEQDEISLLDILVTLAENAKLLIIGPLLAGLLALGIGYTLPQSFTSYALLAAPSPPQVATMMVSPSVLDPVIAALNLSAGESSEVARAGLASRIKASVGKDGLLRLEVGATTPLEAQAIGMPSSTTGSKAPSRTSSNAPT